MSEMLVRPIEPNEWDSWDEFVAGSPQGTVFHTTAWKHVVEKGGEGELTFWGCFEDRLLCGGVVFLERERLGQRTAVTPLLTPYCGLLLDEPAGEKFSDQVTRDMRVAAALAGSLIERFSYVNLMNSPALHDVRSLSDARFELIPRFTYLVNLSLPVDELWQRLDGSVRRQVRKAERLDFEITDNLNAADGFGLFDSTFTRRGEANPISRAFFDEIVESERLRDSRRIFCAIRQGHLESFIVSLSDNHTTYYALAATDEDALSDGVSSYLVWEMIKTQALDGMKTLDFMGANIPSIARFKEGFNPRLQIYFHAQYFSSALLKLGKQFADRIR